MQSSVESLDLQIRHYAHVLRLVEWDGSHHWSRDDSSFVLDWPTYLIASWELLSCVVAIFKWTCPGRDLFQSMRQLCLIFCDILCVFFIWNKGSTAWDSFLRFDKIFLSKSLLQCWKVQASESLVSDPSLAWKGRGWWEGGLLDRTLGTLTEIASQLLQECHAARQCPQANRAGYKFTESSFKCCHLAQSTHLQKRMCHLDSHSDQH